MRTHIEQLKCITFLLSPSEKTDVNSFSQTVIVNSPLDSERQGSGGVGAESAAALTAQCSAPLGNPGWDKHLGPVSGGRHSRKGWMDETHLLNIDSELGCRRHDHLDKLQASPTYEPQGQSEL